MAPKTPLKYFVSSIALASLLVVGACSTGSSGADSAMDEQAENPQPTLTDSERVPVGDSPIKGNPSAPVTIVEFSSMQCPFCARAAGTTDQLVAQYPDEVRLVFKHFPLQMQPQARPASIAVEAAHQQGQGMAMRDQLFAGIQQFSQVDMEDFAADIAAELGLDVDQFRRDFNDPDIAATVDADVELGQSLGVRGTPLFLINGQEVSGAQPLARFQAIVDEQLEQVEALRADGVADENIYAAAVEANLNAPQPEPEPSANQPGSAPEPEPTLVDQDELAVNDSYVKGADDAAVTIYEFSSFQCPFCARASGTLRQLLDEYDGQLRLVYKNFPLPFQEQSEPAARAALAAGEQGQFWEMHALLFENQSRFGEEGIFGQLAEQLDLDIDQFEADMEREDLAQQIEAEAAMGRAVGVRGTPGFVINGELVSGAQPIENFREVIDRKLEQ